MMKRREIVTEDRFRSRLIVEGSDDQHTCYHLLKSHKIEILEIDKSDRHRATVQGKIEILPQGGIEKLLLAIPYELAKRDLKHLGIAADADRDFENRWQAIRNILVIYGYQTVPEKLDPEGAVIQEDDKPRVSVWIMPNNQDPGMLEDFCASLVPPSDRLWPIAEQTVEKVIQEDRRFPSEHVAKAEIHTWLAWQEEPGKPLGQAVTKRYFDHHSPQAQTFIQWIRRAFELDPDQE